MASYYIAPGGNDGNAGTLASPRQTLAGGISLATTSGDIINMRTGDYLWVSTSATRNGIIIQNYNTEAVTVSRAHGGTDWTNNARSVFEFTGAWTNGVIRRNPLGGSFTIRHTGAPNNTNNPSGGGYLAVGNTHLDASGIRLTAAADGMVMEDLEIGPIFGFGVSIDIGNQNARISRCDIHNTATGIRLRGNNVTVEDSAIHDNHYMGRSGSQEDFGSEAITCEDGTNWTISNCDMYENWSEYGSQQFGAEGGGISYFNVPDGQGGTIIGNRFWNNQNFIETGNNANGGFNAGGPNAEIAYNVVFGKNDYMVETSGLTQPLGGTSAGPAPATTAFMLIRTMRDTDIHHNTIDVNDGSADNAGIRMVWGGTFGQYGDYRYMRVYDNIFRVRFATPVYNANNQGWAVNAYTTPDSAMLGVELDHNLIYYAFDRGTGNVFASTGTADDATVNSGPTSQLVNVRGLCVGDVWGDTNTNQANADPDFVNATSANLALRDYHLLPGSPALTMARDGGHVGALGLSTGSVVDGAASISGTATKTGTARLTHGGKVTATGVATATATGTTGTGNIQDTFGRTTINGWGDAEIGGSWTAVQGAVANYAVNGSEGTLLTSAASPARTVRLLSVAAVDLSGSGRIKVDQVLTGTGGLYTGLLVRRSADNLYNYRFVLHFDAGGGTRVDVTRYTNGVETSIRPQPGTQLPLLLSGPSGVLSPPAGAPTYTAAGWLRYRYSISSAGGTSTLRWRIWTDGTSEPATWDITAIDASAANQGSGDVALASFVDAGITNASLTISHDDILGNLPYIVYDGVGVLDGIATLTGAATRLVTAAAAVSGVASTTAAGTRTVVGAASVTGVATVAAAAQQVDSGTASLSAIASVTAAATVLRNATASASGVATVAAAGSRHLSALTSVTGVATTAGAGSRKLPGASSVAGAASLAALATQIINGAGSLTGVADMTSDTPLTREGAASITALATIASLPMVLVAGVGSLAAEAETSGLGSLLVSGTGSLAAEATIAGVSERVHEAAGSVVGLASVIGSAVEFIDGAASLLAESDVAGAASLYLPGFAILAATADVAGVPERVIDGAALALVLADMTATAERVVEATGEMVGVATLLGRSAQRPGYARVAVRGSRADVASA